MIIDGSEVEATKYKDQPETDKLATDWDTRISAGRKHWDKFYRRVKHNRANVAGINWEADPTSRDFNKHRANLIQGTLNAIIPNIYARNPEMSVSPRHKQRNVKLLGTTVQTVTNRQLVDAKLKRRAKSTVLAALTCSYGILKVMYQRDIKEDPIIKQRIQDTQDNILQIEGLVMQLTDPDQRANQDVVKAQLQQTLKSLEEKREIVAAEGMVIDRVMTENLVLDPTIAEFWDYEGADWMCEIIPMKRSKAEAMYGYKLGTAKTYKESVKSEGSRIFSPDKDSDPQIVIYEIWDKQSNSILTKAEGCDFFLKPAFSPITSKRWYCYFLLPFQVVDGEVVAQSLVDLLDKLQDEHNDARDKYNEHRDLIKPGYIATSDVDQKSIKSFKDSVAGEIVIFDSGGRPLQQVFGAKQHPPIDQAAYDTSGVRYDWEQVSGMQDAARSSVVQAKTATEANILQQSLSGRVSGFRDQVEDFLQEVSQHSAQILLQSLPVHEVERIMGPHKQGPLAGQDGQPILDPMTGQPMTGVVEPAYDWPQMAIEEVFDLVQLQIRAGTTGEPDKLEQQEVWLKMLPAIQPLIMQIMQIQATGGDAEPLIVLLKETVSRFDERLDVETLIPKKPVMPMQAQPQMQPA
jgi:hypothetical protein